MRGVRTPWLQSLIGRGQRDFADCEGETVLFARCGLQDFVVIFLLRERDEAKSAGVLCSLFKADERLLDLSLRVMQEYKEKASTNCLK